VELKSLKLYLFGYRSVGTFHEAVVNKILSDLVEVLAPRFMEVVGDFNIRGGIHTMVTARHGGSPTGLDRNGGAGSAELT
jgi:7-cyano-7-deazaguanine reductase